MKTPIDDAALPDIFLSDEDHDTLSRLVGDLPGEGVAGLLQQELDRAVVGDEAAARASAGLYRWIHYADGKGAQPRRVQIVMPKEADIDAGKVSILSHVGAGLIGLGEGQTIAWTDPAGKTRELTLVKVEPAA